MAYRVVQWATGGVGVSALGAIIDHPDLELAGVYVYSDAKVGQDAGVLTGRPDTGVLATNDKDAILALDADVVIHAPLGHATTEQHDKDVTALLRSGKNVISAAGYGSPWLFGDDYVAMLESACAEGSATLYGTGLDPDLVLRIPAQLSTMCTEVKSIRIGESCFMASNPNAGLMVDTIGFGKHPSEFNMESDGAKYLMSYLPQIIDLLAAHLGMTVDRIEPSIDIKPAERDFSIACTDIKKGTMAGAHLALTAYRGDDPFIVIEFFWMVEKGIGGMPEPKDQYRWLIDVEGKPAINLVMDVGQSMHPELALHEEHGFYATAAVAINSIPMICAAKPGLFRAPVIAPWAPRMAAPVTA